MTGMADNYGLSDEDFWQILQINNPPAPPSWGLESSTPGAGWIAWGKKEITSASANPKLPIQGHALAMYIVRFLRIMEAVVRWREYDVRERCKQHGYEEGFLITCVKNGLAASGREPDYAYEGLSWAKSSGYILEKPVDDYDLLRISGRSVRPYLNLTFLGRKEAEAISPMPPITESEWVECQAKGTSDPGKAVAMAPPSEPTPAAPKPSRRRSFTKEEQDTLLAYLLHLIGYDLGAASHPESGHDSPDGRIAAARELIGLETFARIRSDPKAENALIGSQGFIESTLGSIPYEVIEFLAEAAGLSLQDARQCSLVELVLAVKDRRDTGWEAYEGHGDWSRKLKEFAKVDCSVLLAGETGTGKEYAALEIHRTSARRGKPFLPLNCSGLTKERFEAELFGWKKGAFTGAEREQTGLARSAEGGTIFLDEIGDLPPECQANLLRFLQEKEVRPLGGSPSTVDVRIIAATNKPQRLPPDTIHRFDSFLVLPPLRHRRDDIRELARGFFARSKKDMGKASLRLSGAELDSLAESTYPWPGNIRQLQKAILNAVLHHAEGREVSASEILAAASDIRRLA